MVSMEAVRRAGMACLECGMHARMDRQSKFEWKAVGARSHDGIAMDHGHKSRERETERARGEKE